MPCPRSPATGRPHRVASIPLFDRLPLPHDAPLADSSASIRLLPPTAAFSLRSESQNCEIDQDRSPGVGTLASGAQDPDHQAASPLRMWAPLANQLDFLRPHRSKPIFGLFPAALHSAAAHWRTHAVP